MSCRLLYSTPQARLLPPPCYIPRFTLRGDSTKTTFGRGTTHIAAAPRRKGRESGQRNRRHTETHRAPSHDDAVAIWRLLQVKVPLTADVGGKDSVAASPGLLDAVCKALRADRELISESDVAVVRKSFDARDKSSPCFVYTVDVPDSAARRAKARGLRVKPGILEPAPPQPPNILHVQHAAGTAAGPASSSEDPVIVVGSGPAGYFAALALAEAGRRVVVLERGQPVEIRGRDIGALVVRRKLNPDSNLCYGEGGAGTWSDGKLTTRIGRNSGAVRTVLQAFVDFGAPPEILVSGKPHLGTDRMVRILQGFRTRLQALGVDVRFGETVEDVIMEGGSVRGVKLKGGETVRGSRVVLAVGHSARPLYERLREAGAVMEAKPFAMGFRIEHPQELIDTIQYGAATSALVDRGKGTVPVADYRLTANNVGGAPGTTSGGPRGTSAGGGGVPSTSTLSEREKWMEEHVTMEGDSWEGIKQRRNVYSFCMCPGGLVLPTSVEEDELCVNGMSFSRRNSPWANSAVVVGVLPADWREFKDEHGPLAGVRLQEETERRAARMGGGGMKAPVQRVTDFLDGRLSEDLPPLSYRLGGTSARLDTLYPDEITAALKEALWQFDSMMPGFVTRDATLYGAETRTSSPVRVVRDEMTLESASIRGLYPCGEGAGYAGGIVSAAVDGLRVASAVLRSMGLSVDDVGGKELAGDVY